MTSVMTSEVAEVAEVVVSEAVVDLSLLRYNPMIECPVDVKVNMKMVYIFTQWYSQIPENVAGLVSMTDASLLEYFDVYYTYINSKKCKAIRKTKEMYPTVNYEKKNKTVLDSEGNVVVAKRVSKKKEVNVEVGSDVEVPVVAEKKKRVSKKKEVNVEVDGEVVSDGEVQVAEKKKRVSKKKEVNVEVVSDVVIPVVAEKKKRVSKKKDVENVVVENVVVENENVVVEVVEKKKRTKKTVATVVDVAEKKKKSAKKTKVVAEEDDEEITEEDVANAMQYLQDMEERMQELEEED